MQYKNYRTGIQYEYHFTTTQVVEGVSGTTYHAPMTAESTTDKTTVTFDAGTVYNHNNHRTFCDMVVLPTVTRHAYSNGELISKVVMKLPVTNLTNA